MKKATKWISAVGAVSLTAALAVAGVTAGNDHEGREGHEGRGRHEMAAKLNLTDAQKQQWDAIKKTSREQNAEFFKKSKETMEAFRAAKDANDTAKLDALKPAMEANRAQMKQIRAAENEKLSAILTAEQKAQFQAMQAERASHEGHWQH